MKSSAFEPGLSNFLDFSQFATDTCENNKSTSGVFIMFSHKLFILLAH